jgi:xanthine/uracil permease
VNFSSWTPKERLISAAFFAVAVGCLLYGFASGVAPMSSEFFSMFAVVSLVIGLALTASAPTSPSHCASHSAFSAPSS